MTHLKGLSLAAFSILVSSFGAAPAVAGNPTPDFYKCYNRVTGEWNYGRAPYACDANAFGDDSFVTKNYAPVIFKDANSRETERKRYGDELYAVVKEAAKTYLKKRKPAASTAEVDAWTLGIVATSAHESYWTHYRVASDNRLKMMRGDSGHGHGLMQIDDRAHYPAVNNGTAWNMITNMTYGMDIFYAAWERAPLQSCVGSATNWTARIRSAWSAYNGGPGQICRWTSTTGTWAANDKNFYEILTGRRWLTIVTNQNKTPTVAVSCLMEKKENCVPGTPTPDPEPTTPQEGRLYRIAGNVCLVKNRAFHCLDDERDRSCLSAVGSVASDLMIDWSESQASGYTMNHEDRHLLCKTYDRSLVAVGSGVLVKKSIYLRATPAGGSLSVVPAGSKLQVRDFELRGATKDRYYRVRWDGKEGYFYGGNQSDASDWATEVNSKQTLASSMARLKESVQIVSSVGINLRSTPGGNLVSTIPANSTVKVLEIVARTGENRIYYKVKHAAKTGYIYAGMILPTETLSDWAVPVVATTP